MVPYAKFKSTLRPVKCYKLLVSNPVEPRLYGLPKIHKGGDQYRLILSNIDAPTEKIAKWLVQEFAKFTKPFCYSIKNSVEFTQKMSNVEIQKD